MWMLGCIFPFRGLFVSCTTALSNFIFVKNTLLQYHVENNSALVLFYFVHLSETFPKSIGCNCRSQKLLTQMRSNRFHVLHWTRFRVLFNSISAMDWNWFHLPVKQLLYLHKAKTWAFWILSLNMLFINTRNSNGPSTISWCTPLLIVVLTYMLTNSESLNSIWEIVSTRSRSVCSKVSDRIQYQRLPEGQEQLHSLVSLF